MKKAMSKTSTTEVHSGTYVLTEFCKASADTFRVFQELVSTFVDAAFLKSNDIISHSIHLSVMSTKRTSLPVRDLVVKSLAQSSKQRWTRLLYSRRKSFIYHSCQYRNLQVQPSNWPACAQSLPQFGLVQPGWNARNPSLYSWRSCRSGNVSQFFESWGWLLFSPIASECEYCKIQSRDGSISILKNQLARYGISALWE